MDEKPKRTWRRWFRVRLSTVLILTAIIACFMAAQPYKDWVIVRRGAPIAEVVSVERYKKGRLGLKYENTRGFDSSGREMWIYKRERINPWLAGPALALVAFLAWKAFWLIREKRRTAHS